MNIICIVQARVGSERLPGKVLKEIKGKPLIDYTISRLKKSKYINKVILATSNLVKDNKLERYSSENDIECFRGSEENVLERYVKAAEKYKGDIILRVTGDCPLIDWNIIDKAIEKFLENNCDYLRLDVPETFIRGFDVEILTREALEKTYFLVSQISKGNLTRFHEHVTLYIYENKDKFNVEYLKGNVDLIRNYRLCVDTLEDFRVVDNIIHNINEEELFYENIIKYLDWHKDIAEINKEIIQKQV